MVVLCRPYSGLKGLARSSPCVFIVIILFIVLQNALDVPVVLYSYGKYFRYFVSNVTFFILMCSQCLVTNQVAKPLEK